MSSRNLVKTEEFCRFKHTELHSFPLFSFFLCVFHHLYFLQHMALTIINITHSIFESLYIFCRQCARLLRRMKFVTLDPF